MSPLLHDAASRKRIRCPGAEACPYVTEGASGTYEQAGIEF